MITSLSELYFRIRKFILLVQTKKSDFYELWQQQKQLKTMEMSEMSEASQVWMMAVKSFFSSKGSSPNFASNS